MHWCPKLCAVPTVIGVVAAVVSTMASVGGLALAGDKNQLKGNVAVDGSSTVYPIAEAMAEEFQKSYPEIHVTLGASGTGAGYKKFASGELDIANGSRGIKAEEAAKCKAQGIEFMELPVALDGLTVVVNTHNTFVKELTFAQLKQIWEPGSKVRTWHDVDAAWPEAKIKLFGPSSEHGTFDFFTEAVIGKAKASRSDYNAASDTNTLVAGVAGDVNALGYFGYAYFLEGKKKVRAVPLSRKSGEAPVSAEDQTIQSGRYPLSRPLFMTVSKKAAERPEVATFVRYVLSNAKEIVGSVGYSPLPAKLYETAAQRFEARTTGPWPAASP